MIALFDEPYRVTVSDLEVQSRVGLLLGMVYGPELEGLVLLEDGSLTLLGAAHFTIDFRYDVTTDRWMDLRADEPPSTDLP